ncbi:hypothetical protein AVENP_1322 [Arcobacter venerupis]|uniref:Uncharacterized protein n=1 Tax=Arcobacter venerupis TaxID=1054033 RepID=A0AAE7B931_9BACT|nr:hypothetical protein [Arcobacter venerupis]QKF66876.1 hypothetical protein AVENP_1322 [Arcobacter venerupis]
MNKEVTFHINNMAYTINVDESIYKELTKYLNLEKNNDTRDLLAAYIRLSQEYNVFKKDIEDITNKLSRF